MPDTDAERLKALEERIAKARGPEKVKHHSEEHYSQAQMAWRMVIEMVSGLAIGFGIGYGLDTLLGTMPVMMVIFVLAGLAAGVKVMMRTAAEMHPPEGGADTDPSGTDPAAGGGKDDPAPRG